MEKNSEVKAVCTIVLFLGIVAAIGFGTAYFNYAGVKVDEEYGKMCDQVQSRILLKQDAQGEFALKIKDEIGKLKKDFKDASIPVRSSRFVEMQRQFAEIPCNETNVTVAVAYNGVKVTKESELSFFPLREKYYSLERQMSVNWNVLSANGIAKIKWNEMVDKIEAAEEALQVADQAIKDAEDALNDAAKK